MTPGQKKILWLTLSYLGGPGWPAGTGRWICSWRVSRWISVLTAPADAAACSWHWHFWHFLFMARICLYIFLPRKFQFLFQILPRIFLNFAALFFLNTAAQFTECRRVECWSNWFYQGLVDFYFCKEKIGLGRGQSPFRIQEYTYRKCRFIP